MGWVYLSVAIVSEVAGTVALRYAEGFTRPGPVAVVAVGYGASFYLLSLALRTLSLSTSYAVWAGVGTALIALFGVVVLKEQITVPKVIGLVLIVGGVALLEAGGHAP